MKFADVSGAVSQVARSLPDAGLSAAHAFEVSAVRTAHTIEKKIYDNLLYLHNTIEDIESDPKALIEDSMLVREDVERLARHLRLRIRVHNVPLNDVEAFFIRKNTKNLPEGMRKQIDGLLPLSEERSLGAKAEKSGEESMGGGIVRTIENAVAPVGDIGAEFQQVARATTRSRFKIIPLDGPIVQLSGRRSPVFGVSAGFQPPIPRHPSMSDLNFLASASEGHIIETVPLFHVPVGKLEAAVPPADVPSGLELRRFPTRREWLDEAEVEQDQDSDAFLQSMLNVEPIWKVEEASDESGAATPKLSDFGQEIDLLRVGNSSTPSIKITQPSLADTIEGWKASEHNSIKTKKNEFLAVPGKGFTKKERSSSPAPKKARKAVPKAITVSREGSSQMSSQTALIKEHEEMFNAYTSHITEAIAVKNRVTMNELLPYYTAGIGERIDEGIPLSAEQVEQVQNLVQKLPRDLKAEAIRELKKYIDFPS